MNEVVRPKPKLRYVVYAPVHKVELVGAVDGVGGEWFVHFEGSWEAICFGAGEQPFQKGEVVKISFEAKNA